MMEGPTSAMLKCVPSFAKGLKVLVVDHETTSLMYMASMLEGYSYKVATTELAAVALSVIQEQKDRFQLVIANANMPDMNLFTFIKSILDVKDLPIVLFTSAKEQELAIKALYEEVTCFYLKKPIHVEDFKYIWQHVYRKRRLPMEVETNRANHVKVSDRKKAEGVDRASGIAKRRDLCGVNDRNKKAHIKGKNKITYDKAYSVGRNWVREFENTGSKQLIIRESKEQGGFKRKSSNEDIEAKTKGKRLQTSFESEGRKPVDKEGRERKDSDNGNAKEILCLLWDEDPHLKSLESSAEGGERDLNY